MALQIYKKEQGKYVRVLTAIGVGLVLLVLCYYAWLKLDQYLPGSEADGASAPAGQAPPASGETAPGGAPAAAMPYKVYVEYAAPALAFLVMAVVSLYYMNKPVVVDFLIATESEMKKVSWSSRAELLGSTGVVLMTVMLLALFIWVADVGIISVLSRVLGLW